MRDTYERKIEYMRISITDRCNLRCKYCMPTDIRWLPMESILTYEEILMICRQAVDIGITKFKITGGEPLVRKGCANLIAQIKGLPGAEQVTLTSNGVLVKEKISDLKSAGLDAINISLDTLDREKFHEITGFDSLETVLDGIRAAENSGIKVKLNVVLQKNKNDAEWQSLLEIAHENAVDVRFIEMMPIGFGDVQSGVSNEELLKLVKQNYQGVETDESIHGNGPAVYYKIPGFKGSVGFISAMHGKFCSACNRIRMTSTGELKPCLCYGDTISVKEAVRAGDEAEIRKLLKRAVDAKPESHNFEDPKKVTEKAQMVKIGG